MAELAEYNKKRNFKITAEPAGRVARGRGHSFVIQKHDATRLHYDFRLEVDGVLKSWAVPKGPCLDPAVKRLAVEVEDHPLSYASFEGTIPAHQYGAGEVIVWDRGSWECEGDVHAQLQKGHLRFSLQGEKLRGTWNLVRTRLSGGKQNWLLIKSHDEEARPESEYDITTARAESVLSGQPLTVPSEKALPRVARRTTRRPVTASSRAQKDPTPGQDQTPARVVGGDAMPDFIAPELATLVKEPPRAGHFLAEIKFDGYRALTRIATPTLRGGKGTQGSGKGRSVTIYTRNANDWSHKFAPLVKALSGFNLESAYLDGEIVALTKEGRSDFQALQNALSTGDTTQLYYYVFDLLYLNGHDLRMQPLVQRKELLKTLLDCNPHDRIRYSDHQEGAPGQLLRHACAKHLEGIVCKDGQAHYVAGRSANWLKVKCKNQQEFLIVGYSAPKGNRQHFGALLLAAYGPDGSLGYVGRVGTGFTGESLQQLQSKLDALATTTPTVANAPRARDVTWVRPELVCQIQFGHFTRDRMLRQAVFQGLREDKKPKEVGIEVAQSSAKLKTKRPASATPEPDQAVLTHPDKVLFPPDGPTKQELADYYERVAPRMLPYVQHRPLALLRCPNGIGKQCFFQKHLDSASTEPGLAGVTLKEKAGTTEYRYLETAQGLRSLIQLGALELHLWGSRVEDAEHADELVFDLDPAPDVAWKQVVAAARLVRDVLSRLGLKSFPKLTGGKGVHLHVPIAPRYDWQQVKSFTNAVAKQLEEVHPELFTATASKASRVGKIYVDYLRNQRGAHYVAPYSPRAREGAPVAVPISWPGLSARVLPNAFTVRTIAKYLRTYKQDPWPGYFQLAQRIALLD